MPAVVWQPESGGAIVRIDQTSVAAATEIEIDLDVLPPDVRRLRLRRAKQYVTSGSATTASPELRRSAGGTDRDIELLVEPDVGTPLVIDVADERGWPVYLVDSARRFWWAPGVDTGADSVITAELAFDVGW